jgi:hypothetical protein
MARVFGQCQALNDRGKRCRRLATHPHDYHGDNEIYGWHEGKPSWVRVELCEMHRCEDKPVKKIERKR